MNNLWSKIDQRCFFFLAFLNTYLFLDNVYRKIIVKTWIFSLGKFIVTLEWWRFHLRKLAKMLRTVLLFANSSILIYLSRLGYLMQKSLSYNVVT